MAALGEDRNTPARDGGSISMRVGAGVKVYAGSLVARNATGYIVPGSVATTLLGMGRSESQVDNTGGADGDVTVIVRKGVFRFANEGTDLVSIADIGNDCFIVDDQTVAKTNGGSTRSVAGKVVDVDSDGVWVKF